MKDYLKLLPVVYLALVMTGCANTDQPDQGQKKLRFIFITTVVNEDFFMPVKKGMEDAALMLNVECSFTGTEGVDVAAQARMVRQAVRGGYDGITLNIIDPVAFDTVVHEAIKAGIPVVAFNVDDHATPNERLSSVSQHLYEAGKKLGREAAKFIPDNSEIMMTMHDQGVSALEDRLHGIQEGLMEAGREHLKWIVVITGNTVEESTEVIIRELQAHPQIKYILSTGQADTEGAGNAISRHFSSQGYQTAGFDLSPEILQHIIQGHISFTIDQQPYIQGFYPVVQLTLLKRYGIIPTSMDTGAALITSENAESVVKLSEKHYR